MQRNFGKYLIQRISRVLRTTRYFSMQFKTTCLTDIDFAIDYIFKGLVICKIWHVPTFKAKVRILRNNMCK